MLVFSYVGRRICQPCVCIWSLAVTLLLCATGCATGGSTNKTPTTTHWVPLVEGSSLMMNDAHKYHPREIQLSNGSLLRGVEWEVYLKDYILSLPLEKRHDVVDGLTRHHHDYDEVEKLIKFKPIQYFSGPYHNTSYVGATGTISAEDTELMLVIKYYGSYWLFAERVKVVVGDYTWESRNMYFRREHDTNVWETGYISIIGKDRIELAEKIASSEKVIVRVYGRDHYHDIIVSEAMKADIKAAIIMYQALTR